MNLAPFPLLLSINRALKNASQICKREIPKKSGNHILSTALLTTCVDRRACKLSETEAGEVGLPTARFEVLACF